MSQFKTKENLIKEYLRCGTDFEYCCETYFKIEDKRKGKIVPFILMPHQKKLFDLYQEYDKVITNKYRQSGITSVTLAVAAWLLMFTPNTKICVVANKLSLGQKVLFKVIVDFIKSMPDGLRPTFTEADSKTHKILDNGSELFVAACTPDGIRGFASNILILDECSFYEDGAGGHNFFTSSLPALSMGGKLFCISTPNGRGNLFYDLFEGAKNNENGFTSVELKWYHDIRLIEDLEFIFGDEKVITFDEQEQQELISKGYRPTSSWFKNQCKAFGNDSRKIAQELEGVFIGSGGTIIPDEDLMIQEVQHMREPITYEEFDKNMWIWKHPTSPDEKYIMGVDVSSGYGDDYSTIVILNINTREQVAEYRGKLYPDDLATVVDKWGRYYNHAYTVIEITGGYGTTTVLQLLNLNYPNLHYSPLRDTGAKTRLENYQKYDGNLPGFQIGINRVELINDLVMAFRGDESGPYIIIHSSRLLSELKKFKDYSGRANHSRSSHDDLIFALILAIHVSQNSFSKINNGAEKAKAMVASWMVVDPTTFRQDDEYNRNHWASNNEIEKPKKKDNSNDSLTDMFFVI